MTLLDDLSSTVTADSITEYAAAFRVWISDNIPTIDVNDPVINALVITPWVTQIARLTNRVNILSQLTALSSSTIADLTASYSEADVAQFLSELHGVDNSSVGYATGEIRILFMTETPTRYLINAGTVFVSSGGVSFQTSASYVVTGDGAGSTIQLRKNAGGGYYTTIPVIAVNTGAASNIGAGTQLTTTARYNVAVEITADDNFRGGSDGLTVSEVLRKIKYRYTASTLNTREQIVNYMSNLTALGRVSQVGVVGVGDGEMLRSNHPFLPVHKAGAADIYVAHSDFPKTRKRVVQGVVTAVTNNRSTISIPIANDDAPAYLKILSLRDVSTDEVLSIVSETRSYNQDPKLGVQLPLIQSYEQATFSAFQSAMLVATLSRPLTEGSQVNIEVSYLAHPGIAEAQEAVSSRLIRSLGGDVLIRSAVPILLSIEVDLVTQYELAMPNLDLMRAAIVAEIGSRPMRAAIFAADIVRSINRYLPADVVPGDIRFTGELITTSGKTVSLYGTNQILCPDDKLSQMTSRTCAFYMDAATITFTSTRLLAPSTP